MAVYECLKCGGTGYIAAFANIANGDCFTCKGTGKVHYKPRKKKKVTPLTDYQRETIETIKTADFSRMSYKQLFDLRKFAHWPIPQEPGLLEVWRERGETFFFEAQERRLAEMGR